MSSKRIHLVGGRLISGLGGQPLDNALVTIVGRHVEYAGPNHGHAADGGRCLDCSGQSVMPGLIDAHVHLEGPCTFRPIHTLSQQKLAGLLRCGITSVLDLGAEDRLIYSLVESERHDLFPSPRISAAGQCLTAPGGHGAVSGSRISVALRSESEARETVRNHVRRGWRRVKVIYERGGGRVRSLSPALLSAVIDEAHEHDIPAIVHISTLDQAREAIHAGADTISHVMTDRIIDKPLLKTMEAKGVACIPTLVVHEAIAHTIFDLRCLEWPLVNKAVDPAVMEELKRLRIPSVVAENITSWQRRFVIAKANVFRMAQWGIQLALGTDAGNPGVFFGPSVHREMQLMREAGLSSVEVLTTVTRNAAALLDNGDKLGVIAPNKLADLVIVRGNPVEQISDSQDIVWVIKNGEFIEPGQPNTRGLNRTRKVGQRNEDG